MKIISPSASLVKGLAPYELIERIGRTCYKSEDKIEEGSAEKFIAGLMKRQHYAMIEHSNVIISMSGNLYDSIRTAKDETGNYAFDLTYIHCSCVEEEGSYVMSGSFRAWRDLFLNAHEDISYMACVLYYEYPLIFKDVVESIYEEIPSEQEVKSFDHCYVMSEEGLKILYSNHPELLMEHITHTAHFICDRGVTHELVRHRPCAFAQESTRYCLAGDTKLQTSNPHNNKLTIEGLYTNSINSKNGAYKRIKIKQMNEYTGEFEYSKIKNVFLNGEKEVFRITTELGYTLKCTSDHEIYTSSGYIKLKDLSVGDSIYVNGIEVDKEELYKNHDWLYYQNITLNKTFIQIADEFGFNVNTVKKWARKLNIPKKGTGYFNVGREPWNKGLTEKDDPRVKIQAEALRTYHCDGRHDGEKLILKKDTSEYQKYLGKECECCGSTENLEVHHKDKNRDNNEPSNLMTLCESCHGRIHNMSLEIPYEDKIVSIEHFGTEKVYDIEMDSEYHNFVANGVVVHNCNYSKGKFGSEITVILPCFFDTGMGTSSNSLVYEAWKYPCEVAERKYFELLNYGATPQEARSVLPNSLKTEIYVTTTEKEWQHIVDLRYLGTTGAPHPQMKEVMSFIVEDLVNDSDGRINLLDKGAK